MISIHNEYIFTSSEPGSYNDEIIEDHYDDGMVSDQIWDHYDYWSSLDGSVVSVISVFSKYGVDRAKVFIKNKGFEWWFTAKACELTLYKGQKTNNPSAGNCTCDLAAIMVRGCRCGGS